MYCTVDDIKSIPIFGDQVGADELTIIKYIGQAELVVNGMCRSKGFSEVPFTVVPPEMKMVTAQIAVGLMLKEIKGFMGVEDSNAYMIQNYYNDAIKLLKEFAEGRMYLETPVAMDDYPGNAVFVEGTDYTSEDYDRPWEL